MKFLHYTSAPWPDLTEPFGTFPHPNRACDPDRAGEVLRDTLAHMVAAEDVGFDWLGMGEEHMNAYGMVPNPTQLLAVVAARTRRASIAVLGNPLPLLNPVRVAEEYAMIDVLSDGRLVAGFPRGVPQNYSAYGISTDDSRDVLCEAIDLVLAAWERPEPFAWQGKHFSFPAVSIWPRPVQRRPEIVMSSKSAEGVRMAAKRRAVMAEIFVRDGAVLEHFETSRTIYLRQAAEDGWSPGLDRFAINVPCVIASSDAAARRLAAGALHYQHTCLTGSFEVQKQALANQYYQESAHLLGRRFDSVADRIAYGGLICGSPGTAVDQIRTLLRRHPVGVLGLQTHFGNLTPDHVHDSLVLFGARVRDDVLTWDAERTRQPHE
ncbi:LLM class flavin-dependent oxidoreductase [Streptomyces sp. NPDC005963]|uniref:LLM class flavin-dependent oxidoreductase n=1 Tax=Streptomyces sp. NPDC005963 TaxID=3156721 RepID=UPI00340B34BB